MPPEGRGNRPAHTGTIAAIAGVIGDRSFPAGDRAALRRLGHGATPDGPFWRLVACCAPEAFDDVRLERALATVVRCMALAVPFHAPEPGEQRTMGRALAETGFSEDRLRRLLRSDRERLEHELGVVARFVQAKGPLARFDWTDALWLLLTADTADERSRARIARDYYRTLHPATQAAETGAEEAGEA